MHFRPGKAGFQFASIGRHWAKTTTMHTQRKTDRRMIVYFVALLKKSKAFRPMVRIGVC